MEQILNELGLVGEDMSELPTAIATATFTIFGVEVQCHVLSDGQRVIDADSLTALFDAMADVDSLYEGEVESFAKWARGLGATHG